MSLSEWANRFHQNPKSITLTIKGQTYNRSDCEEVGSGSFKLVYKIKGQPLCFFTPRQGSEEDWEKGIETEKYILDEMCKLGLKTNQFEIVPIEIHAPDKPSYTIKALLTQDFESLCEDESLLICDHKSNSGSRHIGVSPDFVAMKDRFKEKEFVQTMFHKIIKEYAIAYACKLPIDIMQANDDSQHICFELAENPEKIPVARYMFWDVVDDMNELAFLMPLVPTLSELKKGPDNEPRLNDALCLLANAVVCAMPKMTYDRNWNVFKQVSDNILKGMDDDSFLNEALSQARIIIANYFSEFISNLGDPITSKAINNNFFVGIMISAISTENLDLVKRCYQFRQKVEFLSLQLIDKVMESAAKYGNKLVIEYLNSNLVVEKEMILEEQNQKNIEEQKQKDIEALKINFLQGYNLKLASDKRAWHGLYSFFCRSHINNDMSLEDMVEHARGLSDIGTGRRSQSVMKEMGWLNSDNEICGEISPYFPN